MNATTEQQAVDKWTDVMLDALRESDGGDNPFYADDEDTVSLARQLAEAVVFQLQAAPSRRPTGGPTP